MKPRLGGPERDAEGGRHVGQLEIVTETERQQRSVPGVEMTHCPRHFVARRQASRAVRRGRRLVEAERHDPARGFAPARVYRARDDDPAKPRRPAVGFPQLRQLAPGSHERLLERVFRVEVVAQDGQAQPKRIGRFEVDQVHESVAVSGRGCDDEIVTGCHLGHDDAAEVVIRSKWGTRSGAPCRLPGPAPSGVGHFPRYVAPGVAIGDVAAAVVELLALAEADLELGIPRVVMYILSGHEGQALGLGA